MKNRSDDHLRAGKKMAKAVWKERKKKACHRAF